MLSGVIMLRQMGGTGAGERIQEAVERVHREGRWLTGDIGGKATTGEFAKAVIGAMA